MSFVFTPVTGLSDTAAYPTTPANEAAARQQIMDPMNQIRDYMNNSLSIKNPSVTWIAPTLLNGWVNQGGTLSTAGYIKNDMRLVQIKGYIKSGLATSGTPIFILPVGYRPLESHRITAHSFDGTNQILAVLNIDASGVLSIIAGSNVGLIIESAFLAEQ